MIKKTKKHTIYEVWNEYLATSVFIDHKPTKNEFMKICYEEKWIDRNHIPPSDMLRNIHTYKLDRLYTRT
jgi:hypothetical protein